VPGYEQVLEILANPAHPEHLEMLVWIGNSDQRRFDLDVVNADLVESFADKPKQLAEELSTPEGLPQT
jgi:hypothetical protein